MVDQKRPSSLNFQEILADLNNIPINQQDVLFDLTMELDVDNEYASNSEQAYVKLEKLVLFKANLKSTNSTASTAISAASNSKSSQFSLNNLLCELDSLESRLVSLKNFVTISSKFISLNK
jgi:hypothetical protein